MEIAKLHTAAAAARARRVVCSFLRFWIYANSIYKYTRWTKRAHKRFV